MEFKIPYKVKNIMDLCGSDGEAFFTLDDEIGRRFDSYVHARVNGKFAIEEILREAEDFFRDKHDDEYSHGLWRSEFWGKLMLSAVRVCKMKKDEKLKSDIKNSVYRVLSFQKENGYLNTYRREDFVVEADPEVMIKEVGWPSRFNWSVWGRKYTLWALIEAAQLLDDQIVLSACEKMADHLMEQLCRLGLRLKDTGCLKGLASCSILKPMLVLYRLTGKKEYLDFCLDFVKEWQREDNECPNLINNALSGKAVYHWYDDELWGAKAYEMMSCFDGICELYRVTGDMVYLDAVSTFCDMLVKHESNILGSVGYCENFRDAAEFPDAATEICDVIHWMRLCHEMFVLTGEQKHMDRMEKAFVNAFLAGIYEGGGFGAFFVRSAGRQWNIEGHCESKYQHCCLNNLGRGFVNAAESVITKASTTEDYYINMYVPARVNFGKVDFRVACGYFDSGKVAVSVRGAAPGTRVHFRIPDWSKNTEVIIGDTQTSVKCGEYYTVTVDESFVVIRFVFDMTVELIDFKGKFQKLPENDYHYRRWIDDIDGLCGKAEMCKHPMTVLRRGPVMLARSKRLGDNSDSMFSGETVFGAKERTCTASRIRHDHMLVACRVTLVADGVEKHLIMCDYASAANRDVDLGDTRYFTLYV